MTIPLVRTRYLLDQIHGYERIGGDSDRLLRQVGVPLEVLESPESLIPLVQFERFSHLAISDAGLALSQSTSPHELSDLGAFGARLSQEPSLYAALMTFFDAIKAEATRLHYFHRMREDALWVCWTHDPGRDYVHIYSEHFSVYFLLAIIRHWAGDEWLPQEIWFRSTETPEDDAFGHVQRVRHHASLSAIVIPKEVLSRSIAAPLPSPTVHEDIDLTTLDLVGATTRVLETYLASGSPSIVALSRALGMSTRSLQRRLGEAGTTHSRLLEDLRRRLAVARLVQPDYAINDIAHELGYSDSAHFSRAFRRWTGLAPLEFRRSRQQ